MSLSCSVSGMPVASFLLEAAMPSPVPVCLPVVCRLAQGHLCHFSSAGPGETLRNSTGSGCTAQTEEDSITFTMAMAPFHWPLPGRQKNACHVENRAANRHVSLNFHV